MEDITLLIIVLFVFACLIVLAGIFCYKVLGELDKNGTNIHFDFRTKEDK